MIKIININMLQHYGALAHALQIFQIETAINIEQTWEVTMFAAVKQKAVTHVELNDLFISLIKTLLVFNLLDGLFTLAYLELGYAVEANPIMAYYYTLSPLWFMLAKNFLMASGCFILHQFIRLSISKIMVFCGWISYFGILVYHLAFLGYWMNTHFVLPI